MRVRLAGNCRGMGRGGGGNERSAGTTNGQRVAWARVALEAYVPLVYGQSLGSLVDEDRTTCLTDLLADLIHYCRHEDIDFELCLDRAFAHAASEAVFLWDQPTE